MKVNNYLLWFSLSSTAIIGYILYLVYRISPFSFGNVVYYCRSFAASALEYLPFAAVVLFFSFIAAKLYFWRKQITFIKGLPVDTLPATVTKQFLSRNITAPIHVFRNSEAYAFCYGILKPTIYISSGLVTLMSTKELVSILLHEQKHISQHDTRIITLLRTVSLILFPFPFFWEITHAYSTEQEIAADQEVYTKTGSFTHLKSALSKLLSSPAPTSLPVFALPFTGYQVYSARIQAIQGIEVTISVSKQPLYYSIGSLLLLSAILLLPVSKTEYKVNDQKFVVMCYDNQSCALSCVDKPPMSAAN